MFIWRTQYGEEAWVSPVPGSGVSPSKDCAHARFRELGAMDVVPHPQGNALPWAAVAGGIGSSESKRHRPPGRI